MSGVRTWAGWGRLHPPCGGPPRTYLWWHGWGWRVFLFPSYFHQDDLFMAFYYEFVHLVFLLQSELEGKCTCRLSSVCLCAGSASFSPSCLAQGPRVHPGGLEVHLPLPAPKGTGCSYTALSAHGSETDGSNPLMSSVPQTVRSQERGGSILPRAAPSRRGSGRRRGGGESDDVTRAPVTQAPGGLPAVEPPW